MTTSTTVPPATRGYVGQPTTETHAVMGVLVAARYALATFTANGTCLTSGAYIDARPHFGEAELSCAVSAPDSADPAMDLAALYAWREEMTRTYRRLFTVLGWRVRDVHQDGRLAYLVLAPTPLAASLATVTARTATVNGNPVTAYTRLKNGPVWLHDHSREGIVGYVVRETCRNGVHIPRLGDNTHAGYDVLVVDGAWRYGETRATARKYRVPGARSVTDTLYRCGCRSGL